MTTLAARELAIEAQYAAQELTAFRERVRRQTRLGFRLAKLLHMHGADARLFALELSRRCTDEPSDEAIYRRMADELAVRGLNLSNIEIRSMAQAGKASEEHKDVAQAATESWPAYVTEQIFALFNADRSGSQSAPDRGALSTE